MFRAPCDANTYSQIIATGFVSAFEIGKGGIKVTPGKILYSKTMAAKGKIQTTIGKIQNGYLKEHFKNEMSFPPDAWSAGLGAVVRDAGAITEGAVSGGSFCNRR